MSSFDSFVNSFDYYYCHSNQTNCCALENNTVVCLEKYVDNYSIIIEGVLLVHPETGKSTLTADVKTAAYASLQFHQLIEVIINELRNPVAGLIATSDLYINYGQEFKLDKDEYFFTSRDYAIKLSRFVDQLLYLLKIESDSIDNHKSPIHLESLLKDCVTKEYERNKHLNLSFKTDFDDELFTEGNEELVRLAMMNLLQNSIYFGKTEREIKLSVFKHKGLVGISFTDYGFGIQPEFATKIFERFFRVRNETSRNHPDGIGIGLTLVKAIVRHQKGKLKLCSKPEIGCEFTMFLPELQLALETV
jgi:signal transduction histidine kinase